MKPRHQSDDDARGVSRPLWNAANEAHLLHHYRRFTILLTLQ